jgi:3-methyladenine DNA glycosylase AlkD
MKSAMPFHGVRMPEVRRLTRALAREREAGLDGMVLASEDLWRRAERREERYAAIELTALPPALGRLELAERHQRWVREGAWWDYTDALARQVAALHQAWPEPAAALTRRWLGDSSMWLRRLAIIGQLGRRERTDRALLAEAIEANAADPEFFIRKAIGWALRDLARSDPDWVRGFAAAHDLSPLSRREALKHL